MVHLIEWKDEFATGIGSIDEQHKEFVSYVNELYDAIHSDRGGDVVGKVLDELIAYTDTHFAFEEQYFKEFGFDDTASHIAEHTVYRDRLMQFKCETGQYSAQVAFELLDFLEDWCLQHLGFDDKKYVECFRSHGLR